jgi:hypothetical protein
LIYPESRSIAGTAFFWVCIQSLPNLAAQGLAGFTAVPIKPLAANWATVVFRDDQVDG